MARKPVVSRTINTYNVDCLVYDSEKQHNEHIIVHLNRNYTNTKMLCNACKKHIPDDKIFINCMSEPVKTTQRMFLTLDEFIKLAHPVEPAETETKKKSKK